MTRIIHTRLLLFLTIFNANYMLAMNKIYKAQQTYDDTIEILYLKKSTENSEEWVLNSNDTINSLIKKNELNKYISKNKSLILITNDKNSPLDVQILDEENKTIYEIPNSFEEKKTYSSYFFNVEESVSGKTAFDTFLKHIQKLQNPRPVIAQLFNTKNFIGKPIVSRRTTQSFTLPNAIQLLTPRKDLGFEIVNQLVSEYEGKEKKPLYLASFTEALLSSGVKNYLLDKWVASINEDDIFFTLATALQKSNSNLSIFGFKGLLALITLQHTPKLLQDNNFYLNHHHQKGKVFNFKCCPKSAIQQILATQLLGLAYQNIAPKKYKDGWLAGPIGQFVFEQAAITAARTNPYGVWSLIGAELIAGYSPNVTGSTLEKEFKKILVHQARTSTFLQALRDLHTPLATFTNKNTSGKFTFKAPNTILKLLAKTAITAVPHCVYHQTPLKKKLKELKKTNPTFAWSIKQIGRYGIPLVVDFAVEEMLKN